MLGAVKMANDERVQTKENMQRTCMLDTEYVGMTDFKLEDGDYEFLWRKGNASTALWLEKRQEKRRKKAARRASLFPAPQGAAAAGVAPTPILPPSPVTACRV